jgi:hypothetical protein
MKQALCSPAAQGPVDFAYYVMSVDMHMWLRLAEDQTELLSPELLASGLTYLLPGYSSESKFPCSLPALFCLGDLPSSPSS